MRLFLTFSILFSLLFQSCADQNFMDRTRKDQSILQGNTIDKADPLSKSIVLIAEDIVFKNDQPFFFGICTGLIISKRVVLTAAHCIDRGYKNTKIVSNPTPRENLKQEEIFRVINAKSHPSYELKSLVPRSQLEPASFEETLGYDDVALLLVDRDFPSHQSNPYYFMPTVQFAKPDLALIAGFGKTTTSKNVESVDFKEMNGSLKQAYVKLTEEAFIQDRILVKQKLAGGVCKGDSGAPMFINENGTKKLFAMAIGIFSKLNFTDPDISSIMLENECSNYGVYLVLSHLQDWIIKTDHELRNWSLFLKDASL